jgi:hypothetical protein|tara:strand:+ start:426 stop:593 length:168 start_codon:yes stop_codon:yes gene_type:complete
MLKINEPSSMKKIPRAAGTEADEFVSRVHKIPMRQQMWWTRNRYESILLGISLIA